MNCVSLSTESDPIFSETLSLEERVKFTSKEWDDDAGLYYYNARWYDANSGRFTSEDPIRDGLNYYVYVNNNPVMYIDPTGLEIDFSIWAGIDVEVPNLFTAMKVFKQVKAIKEGTMMDYKPGIEDYLGNSLTIHRATGVYADSEGTGKYNNTSTGYKGIDLPNVGVTVDIGISPYDADVSLEGSSASLEGVLPSGMGLGLIFTRDKILTGIEFKASLSLLAISGLPDGSLSLSDGEITPEQEWNIEENNENVQEEEEPYYE